MSLIHWWPLNGDTKDYGTSNLTGTLLGSATVTADGKLGKCLTAGNGSASSNGVEAQGNLISELTTSATVACWIKVNGNHYHYNGTIISSGDWNSQCWAFGLSQDNTQVDLFGDGYNRYISCAVSTGVWHHLCCVNNNGTCKVYLDGEYKGHGTDAIPYRSSAAKLCIGRETYAGGYFTFNGYINDVRIYDTCLSEAEIKDLASCLVLHYPLNNGYVEPTTNLSNNLSSTCYNWAKDTYGYGTNTDMYKTSGFFNDKQCEKVYMGTAGADAKPYIYINNMFVSDGGSYAKYKTVSFDYYTTKTTYLNIYKLGSGSGTAAFINYTNNTSGVETNSCTVNVIKNTWNHIEVTFTGTTSASCEWGYMINGDTHISTTTDYWLFANIQVEEKDHATPFTPNSRTETIVPDVSGYVNNGIVSTTTAPTCVNSSIRYNKCYQFDGGTQAIQIPFNNVIKDGVFTLNVWFYKSDWGTDSYETIIGGPSGFELEAKPGGTNTPVIRPYSWGGSGGALDFSYELNKWNMITMTRTATESKFYLNGVLQKTGSAGSIPTGDYFIAAWKTAGQQNYKGKLSDFRLYATVLSQEAITDLYNSPIKITKNGSLITNGEVVE